MTQSPLYDLAIVGASFAGLACARAAALRGLKTLVLERKEEAGARVSTTGILVKEAADEIDLPLHLTRKIRGARLYAPSLKSIDLTAPGYYFLATNTPELMRFLATQAAQAGAEIRFAARFTSAHRAGGFIEIEGANARARFLVGADGAKSRVAQAFDLGRTRKFLVGLEAEIEGLSPPGDVLQCFLDSRLAPGYLGWAVPGIGVTQVGLAVSAHRKPDWSGFARHIGAAVDLANARVRARRSGLIPAGGLVQPFAAPQVLLVGDAAGLVSPMTGGGIRLAHHFGRRVGQVVADYLLDRGGEPGAVMARELPRFRVKGVLRSLMDLAPPNWLIEQALFTEPARALAQQIYFHRRRVPGEPWHEPGTLPEPRPASSVSAPLCV
jgi:flavin-dependent dehydrogenase